MLEWGAPLAWVICGIGGIILLKSTREAWWVGILLGPIALLLGIIDRWINRECN